MKELKAHFRDIWGQSRFFRVVMVLSVVYTVLRLGLQGTYLFLMLSPAPLLDGVKPEGSMVPIDLQVYLDAAKHFQQKQNLYLEKLQSIEYHFPYPPAYAMAFVLFLWLSPTAVAIVHTLLHIVAYVLLYMLWNGIFHKIRLRRASEMMIWTLPVWLVFPTFWSDLGYLNIYIIMALLSTLLIAAVLNEYLGWSVLWLSIILQTKPMWAFAAAVPLLLGRRRFFLKLVVEAILIYAAITGITVLVAGPSYGWEQYNDYFQLLTRLGEDFPWREYGNEFFGYNHSIKQIVIYLLGETTGAMHLATGIKILLLLPLAVVSVCYLLHPLDRAGREMPQTGLDLAFALYLGAFIWLDIVWEVSLGIAVFTYLLATLRRRGAKVLIWVVLLPYLSVDPLRFLGAILSFCGLNTILPGPYILTDPSMYMPIVMIVIVTLYALLVWRLWNTPPVRRTLEVGGRQ
jgi:hypothetical protein